MLVSLIVTFLVVPGIAIGQSTYSNAPAGSSTGGSGSATPAPTAPTSGPSVITTLGPLLCQPVSILHSETGDALFKALLADLSAAADATWQVAIGNPNAKISNSSGFFFSVVVSNYKADTEFRNNSLGLNTDGQKCLVDQTQLGFVIATFLLHKDDVIPGGQCSDLKGEAKYQSILQQIGQAFNAVSVAAAAHMNDANPGPWLTQLLNLVKGTADVATSVANNDPAYCLTSSTQQGKAFIQGVMASNGASFPDCPNCVFLVDANNDNIFI